jgi:Fic family protein
MHLLWERSRWPAFRWDPGRLASQIAAVRLHQGRLLGRAFALGQAGMRLVREEALHLDSRAEEVLYSREIEGDLWSPQLVRSVVASHLGMPSPARPRVSRFLLGEVEGMVEMVLDATRDYAREVDAERLWSWQRTLFPLGRSGLGKIKVGGWRAGPARVGSRLPGTPVRGLEAPSEDRVPTEMDHFLTWLNTEVGIDPLVKAGLAQLWFLTIHPFDDGNGLIARALTELLLARSEGSAQRLYSLSKQIGSDSLTCDLQMHTGEGGSLDVTDWMGWFLDRLDLAIGAGEAALTPGQERGQFWLRVEELPLGDRQRRVLHRLWDGFEGALTSTKVAAMNQSSPDTALRDLEQLVHWGLLERRGGGRSTHYIFPEGRSQAR